MDHLPKFCSSVNMSNRVDDDQSEILSSQPILLGIQRWFVRYDSDGNFDSDTNHQFSSSIYLSHPSSPIISNSISLELSSVQQGDPQHCSSLVNDMIGEKSQKELNVSQCSQVTSEEVIKERAYMNKVIDNMNLESSNWSRDDIFHGNFRKLDIVQNINKQLRMYDAFAAKFQFADKQIVKSEKSNEYILSNDQCFHPQCWIELSKPKRTFTPHISECKFDMEFDNPQSKFSWSSKRTSTSLKSKKKYKKELIRCSEPLLCVTGNNVKF